MRGIADHRPPGKCGPDQTVNPPLRIAYPGRPGSKSRRPRKIRLKIRGEFFKAANSKALKGQKDLIILWRL
jgi:hypothetical protein